MLRWTIASAALLVAAPGCSKINPDFANGSGESGTEGTGTHSTSNTTTGQMSGTTKSSDNSSAESGPDSVNPATEGDTLPTSGIDPDTGDSTGNVAETDMVATSSTGGSLCQEAPDPPYAYLYVAGEDMGDFASVAGGSGIGRARMICDLGMPIACGPESYPILIDPGTQVLDAEAALDPPLLPVVNLDQDCLLADSVADLIESGINVSLEEAGILDVPFWSGIDATFNIDTCNEWDSIGDGATAYLGSASKAGLFYLSDAVAAPCNVGRPLLCVCW